MKTRENMKMFKEAGLEVDQIDYALVLLRMGRSINQAIKEARVYQPSSFEVPSSHMKATATLTKQLKRVPTFLEISSFLNKYPNGDS
jgi:hypothetical protein